MEENKPVRKNFKKSSRKKVCVFCQQNSSPPHERHLRKAPARAFKSYQAREGCCAPSLQRGVKGFTNFSPWPNAKNSVI